MPVSRKESNALDGRLFELLVKRQLEVTTQVKYFALDKDNKFVLDSLVVKQLKIETVRGSSYPMLKESDMPVGYYGAETVGFDIVLSIDGKSHALQLSISKPGDKIPKMAKKREKEQKFHYQYIASPHPVDENVLKKVLKKN